VTAAVLLATIVTVNVVVDPFGMYRILERSGFNAHKPAIQHRVRLAKAYEIRQIKPRGIILGTSRTHLGLRPSHDGWDPTARPVYNLAFDGATTKEMYQYLVHSQAVRPLRQVVLGLDTYHATLAPATVRPDFDPQLLDPVAILGLPSLLRADLKILSSLDTLSASVKTVASQGDGQPEWFARDGQRLGEVFFRRPGERFQQIGPRAYFEEIDRLEVGFKHEGGVSTRSAAGPQTASETSLHYIRQIVAFCRREGVDLRIFIAPEHAHQLEITAAIGAWGTIENAKRNLVQLLSEDAAQHPDAPPIALWDFSGYSSVTTEALPAPGSRAEMRFYWDSSHFKDIVGDLVLDRVFGASDSRRTVPPDFGVRLNADTIDAALAHLRADQLAYRRTNPEDAMWIQSLVEGGAPGTHDTRAVAVSRRP
jgi:hypothetical protein